MPPSRDEQIEAAARVMRDELNAMAAGEDEPTPERYVEWLYVAAEKVVDTLSALLGSSEERES